MALRWVQAARQNRFSPIGDRLKGGILSVMTGYWLKNVHVMELSRRARSSWKNG